ncbi:MAG TPA: DUF4142 domain-containing protein [Dissulfurispiraceae bacterium]
MRKRIALIVTLSYLVFGSFMLAQAADQKGLSRTDKQFVHAAASGGMMEVQLGQMAQQKAQSPEVKDFGSRMVTDHGRANDELKKIAQQKNIALPDQLSKSDKKSVDKLSKASGADFDKKYMETMVKDHANDVAVFRGAAQKVKDPDLNGWATKTLPVLEQHLKLAKDTARKVGVNVDKAEKAGTKMGEKKAKKMK